MSNTETQQQKLVRYLDDAWAFEKALVATLKDMSNEIDDPDVRNLFDRHREMTHQQEEMLEARIRALGSEPNGGKGFLNQIMGKVGDMLQGAHDTMDKATTNLMKAYGTEHFEVAMYESLANYAEAIGDTETAQLARTIQEQERQTADLIWQQIPRVAKQSAGFSMNESARAA